jgi:hypothetical protein
MKQTAIEWLKEKWYSDERITDETFEQALKIENQQIIDAYETAYMDGYYDIGKLGEQYYSETFNK